MDKLEFNNENPILGIKETSPSERLNIGGQQTAVEWLVEKLKNDSYQIIFGKTFASIELIEQAKAMEKLQRIKDYNAGFDDAKCNHINDADNYANEIEYIQSRIDEIDIQIKTKQNNIADMLINGNLNSK